MKKLLFTIIILASALIGSAQAPCWDGNVADTYANGDGTYENPYQIATPGQLALLAEQTNSGTSGNAHYLLTEDLCLNGSQDQQWTPIGNAMNPFTGEFDGNGHIISDLYMTAQVLSGLFGYAQNATIKNVHIEEANIPYGGIGSQSCIGLVVGKALNTNIFSCITNGFVGDIANSCGGIVGQFSVSSVDETFVIRDCVNHADVKSEQGIAGGGIVGQTTIEGGHIRIENCVNYGNLDVWAVNGGIVGRGSFVIKGCDNYGTIISSDEFGDALGGGIAGSTPDSTSIIEDCVNHESGEIVCGAAGGIVAGSGNAVISRCGNKAKIKGGNLNRVHAGGIAASDGRISNCYNTGEVSVECESPSNDQIYIGGISGVIGSTGYVRNCYVTGAVICPYLNNWYGIIAPVLSTMLSNCYWHGDYNMPPSQEPSEALQASSPFEPGDNSTSWILDEAQYGTTDLLEVLNRGSMGECLWVEDVDGVNGGLPIPTEGEIIYPLYGNEWYYEIQNNDGSISYQQLRLAPNDTTIHHKDVPIIIKTNTLYDKGSVHQYITHEYIYQEGNVVHWYNKSKDEFTVLYDFGAMAGDEWEIMVGDETVLIHIDSISFVDYEGETYRKMIIVSDPVDVFCGEILCGVGHTDSFFPERMMHSDKAYRVESIRCYWNDKELIQQWSDVDCDAVYVQYHTGLEEPVVEQGVRVYPNPTDGLLYIETQCIASLSQRQQEYRITNLMGQTLMSGKINSATQQIDIANLPKGMYFILVGSSKAKFILK